MGLFAPLVRDVETGRTPQYPDLQPLHILVSAEKAFSAVTTVAGRQRRWTVVKVDPANRVLAAEARSKVWGMVVDVTVRVEEEPGGSVVHVRSRSRVGFLDFGANAKRIRSFLRQAKAELT